VKVGYLTGCYPRSTDTFIQREVAALRAAGVDVETFAVRTPAEGELVGPEQRAERAGTTYLLSAGPAAMLRAHAALLLRSPARWRDAAALAVRSRQPGLRGAFLQVAYFAEAGLLARLARRRRLDHLHNHFGDSSGSVTMLAARLAALPFSMTIHGPDVFAERSRWRLDLKCAEAAFVVCISQFAKSQVMVVAPVDTWERLHIVHCGVHPELYGEPVAQDGRFRLVTVGRLEQVKGIWLLLEAVAQLRDVPGLELHVVGDGPQRAELEQRARALGIEQQVRFLGAVSQAAVREELLRADLFVTASFAEGIPVVLMEALASRTPVVATRIMGVPELVQDGVAGRLVPPADVDALAAALRDMAALSPQERRAMGEAGQRIVAEQFDVTTEAGHLATLFQAG